MSATTLDAFLGGKVMAHQPARGFRSGVDAVLLAAAVPAVAGETVLELGCGVGVASLCLAARVPGLRLTGVEIQPEYAALAQRNADENGAALTIFAEDLRALPAAVRQVQFTHVMMNPPYFDRTNGTAARDVGRDTALGGDTPLADWIDVAVRRLAPKGRLTMIQHISRLPEVVTALSGRLGGIVIRPIAGRTGQPPNLFLLTAHHSGRAAFCLSPALVMHEGPAHQSDGESYSPLVQAILRSGAFLPMRD